MTSSRRNEGRASAGLLVAILIAAAAAGAWNYRRNLAAEEAERAKRPYAGYATEDLKTLAEAYRAEVAQLEARWQAARGARVKAADRSFFGDQIEEFERVRRRSGQRRAVGAELGETEAALRAVEEELARRAHTPREAWRVHWRRLTRI